MLQYQHRRKWTVCPRRRVGQGILQGCPVYPGIDRDRCDILRAGGGTMGEVGMQVCAEVLAIQHQYSYP